VVCDHRYFGRDRDPGVPELTRFARRSRRPGLAPAGKRRFRVHAQNGNVPGSLPTNNPLGAAVAYRPVTGASSGKYVGLVAGRPPPVARSGSPTPGSQATPSWRPLVPNMLTIQPGLSRQQRHRLGYAAPRPPRLHRHAQLTTAPVATAPRSRQPTSRPAVTPDIASDPLRLIPGPLSRGGLVPFGKPVTQPRGPICKHRQDI